MNKNTKNLVPKLRFPEFVNDGNWKEKILGDVTKNFSNRNKKGIKLPIYSINNKKGFVPQNEQFEGMNSSDRGYDISLYKIIERNTFAYNPARIDVGSIGFSGELHNIIISSLYVCFTVSEEVNNNFLLHFFDTFYFTKAVRNSVEGGIRNYLFYENFSKISVYFPNKNEQKKIANFLSSLDKVIASQNDRLEEIKAHKKGLIQNLFSTEVKTEPKYRFSEFKKNGEWDFKNGNILFEPISNKNHNSDLSILAVTQEHGAIPREKINYNVVVTDKSVESYKIVEIGDFIISLRSFQGGIEYSNYKGICSPAYIILRKKNNKDNDEFYKHYFKSEFFIRDLNRNIEGIRDGKMVSYNQFSEILIPNPEPDEQKKIAECLSSLDNKIEAESKKLDALIDQKKGLLQGLFPKI
ncbi:restriction endonuclease subunit S [Flavobacterium aquidurense]|uniref:HsdS protein n=1 Tax=Flavobacterium aquidurense TaxID=362413 RepID=A0A0Q0VZH6_9FLAO|nr:restriction endonuclease subunit S [Flavobacterium aquidurense]KQB39419.1 HsdS protein [Flavobacterium aquidurense]